MEPNWTDVVSAGASVLTAGGVGVVVYQASLARKQFREVEATRLDTWLDTRYQQWDSEPLRQARKKADSYASPEELRDAMAHLYHSKEDDFYRLISLPNYFEHLAIFVDRRRIDLDVIQKFMGSPIVGRWRQFYPAIETLRGLSGSQTAFDHWEWLQAQLSTGRRSAVAQRSSSS